MVICALMSVSCSVPGDSTLEVSIKYTTVTPVKDQQFVSVKCSGEWTLTLVSPDGKENVDWAELSVTSGKGNKPNVILTYENNNAHVSRKLTIVLDNGSKSAFCTMTQRALGEAPEPEDPDAPTGSARTNWLELPAMNDPNLEYYSYSFKMNGKKYRNYTFGWSQKDYTTVWVAYPLWSTYTNKGVNRTNKWAYDPTLGPTLSPAPFDGFADDYDRLD